MELATRAAALTYKSLMVLIAVMALCACGNNSKTDEPPKIHVPQEPQDTPMVHADNQQQIFPPADLDFKVVGYILAFRKPAAISETKLQQCNVIIYAFAQLQGTTLQIKYPGNLRSLSIRAKKNNCKILIGINGTHAQFKAMTAAAANRNNCIQQIMKTIRNYNLDGVDIDWEFPAKRDKTDSLFTLFLKELSDSCHTNGEYYLSCAITPGVNGGRRSSAIREELLTGEWVDWFNIMIYDNYSETMPYLHHSDFTMARNSFLYWLRQRKMNRNKCVMGLPMYGRPSGIPQSGFVKTYAAILAAGGSPMKDSAIVHIDSTIIKKDTITQYTIYYDGINTIRKKTAGAFTYGGGIMFWEAGQDANGKYSLITAAVKQIGKSKSRKTVAHHPPGRKLKRTP